jgi:Uma2 family endonuclease
MAIQNRSSRTYLSAEDYLAQERLSDFRSEYLAGEAVAMTGGSWEHSLITGNLFAELKQRLRGGPCQAHASDLRVRVSAELYTYPDIVVVCGGPRFADTQRDTVLNPKLIAEVLSPSTESYDRGKKFELYRGVESIEEYVLITQGRPRIERYLRQGANWLLTEIVGLAETMALPSVHCEIPLASIYDGISFPV